MNKSIFAFLLGLAFSTTSFAVENINLDDVVVTASRISQSRDTVIGDVTVINREDIERAGAGSLTDLLRTQPAIQISANGGAGASSGIYLRGTNDQHVVVLIDGLRINSVTTGVTAVENIPLSQMERIEILRGPASSLYGADAIGGVIQIFTRKGEAGKPVINAAFGLGSYGTKTAEAGISGSTDALKYGVNISRLDTDGFSAKRAITGVDTDDDGYRNLSASVFLDLALAQGHTLGLQFFDSQGHAEFDNNFDNFSKQTLQSYAITSKNQLSSFWYSTFKLGMGVDSSESHDIPNTNPLSSSYKPDGISRYRSEQKQISWQNDFNLPVGTLTLAYDRLEQDMDSQSNAVTKFKKERNNNSFLAGYIADAGNHILQLSLREDRNTQFGNYTTGGVGYGYKVTAEWRATVSYGKAFKAPTFNQLYYPNFGDPNLAPEKSENVEASIKYTHQKSNAGITIFENKISDLIEFSGPATAGCTLAGYCPVNVANVKVLGATLDSNWSVNENLLLSGNLTLQSPRNELTNKLLVRRSSSYGSVSLRHTYGNLDWGSEITGASSRYNNASNTKAMPGYILINLTANYKLTPEWKLEARANNILDKDYVLAYTGNTASSVPYNTADSNLFIGLRYNMK